MSVKEIGCCGAYCKPCKAFHDGTCKGCRLGYDNGERDIGKAKCKIKVCCLKSGLNSCADCNSLDSCETVNEFYGKNGYKYGKYKQAVLYIKEKGYEAFLKIADRWKNVYGKYDD